jgi:hypothetical protein
MAYTVWDLLHTHTNRPNETNGSFKFLFIKITQNLFCKLDTDKLFGIWLQLQTNYGL